jgi:hypothetical protein
MRSFKIRISMVAFTIFFKSKRELYIDSYVGETIWIKSKKDPVSLSRPTYVGYIIITEWNLGLHRCNTIKLCF